jgi:hypothetical protein
LYCDIPATSNVVDPWRKFDSMQHQVLWYGNTRPDSIKLHCQV